MSDKPSISAVESVTASRPTSRLFAYLRAQSWVEHQPETVPAARDTGVIGHEHFYDVATQLREHPVFGHEFDHGDDFFHRFMRAAGDRKFATDLHHILVKEHSLSARHLGLSPALMQRILAKRARPSTALAPSVRAETKSQSAQKPKEKPWKTFGSGIVAKSDKPSPGRKLSLTQKMLRDGALWDLEPRYKLSRVRRRFRRWGDKFTLMRYEGHDPFYFDHATTFYPLELKPPPDVDFIPFEYYAASGVLVGWQWLVDQFVRQGFVTDRNAASALDIFLANYRLIGIAPATALQGAIAHYPSEEHMQRILQYLAVRGRAKTRMRIELLDQSGKTVAEAWVDYGVIRRY